MLKTHKKGHANMANAEHPERLSITTTRPLLIPTKINHTNQQQITHRNKIEHRYKAQTIDGLIISNHLKSILDHKQITFL